VLVAILFLQLAAGGHAYAMDLMRPFSNARAAGLHLRQERFAEMTLVGSIDYAIQPIAAYVDRRFFYPESGEFRTFVDWGPDRRLVPPQVVLRESLRLLTDEERDVVIVFSYRPGAMEPGQALPLGPDAQLSCFARFVGAIVPDENYHLCLASENSRRPTPTER
jgi:hypothetical protein